MVFDPFSIYDVPPELETVEPTEEAILRLCAASQSQLAGRLVSSRREETEAVQDSLRTAFTSNPPAASLGDLDRLPHEVVVMILHHLDVLSYFRFRQLNRLARQLCTEFVKEYQVIVTHGLQGLHGLLRCNLDHRFTILDLYRVLTTRDCVLCGAFGGFMYLPSALRCCYPCITTADNLLVLDSTVFCEQAGVSLTEAQPFLVGSTLRTVPGPYDKSDRQDKPDNDRPQYLISAKEALEELATHGLLPQPVSLAKIASEHQQFSTRTMASTALPWYNPYTAKADDGVCCEGEQGDYEWTEHISDRIERAKLDRSFPTDEFFSHFMGCDAAKSWWAVVKYSGQDTRYMKLL